MSYLQASEERTSCVAMACEQFRTLSGDTDRSGINIPDIPDDTATPPKDNSNSNSNNGMSPLAADAMLAVSVVHGSDR